MHRLELDSRVRQIRQAMQARGVDLLLLVRPSHVTYVTGFGGQDSWAVVTARRTCLLTDSRYTEQARKECPTAEILERMGILARAAGVVAVQSKAATVAVDPAITLEDWTAVRRHIQARFKTLPDPVAQIRAIKGEHEIRCIRTAGRLARTALAQALQALRPGWSESELAGLVEYSIRKLGATCSFDTIVAFGPNASRPHHRPTSRRLRTHDTILIDFGARYRGYCSDLTRTLAVGRPSRLFLEAFEAVRRAQAASIRTIRPGAALQEVDAAARAVIRRSGLPVYGHGTGHGIGLDIHEPPFLKPDAAGTLQAGQVITVEPGIYLPGRLGVRLEDDVLVTGKGQRILTRRTGHSYGLGACTG
ncbi:MAG: aminopeptidase P family protein [Phycisphaerae bacterium]|nr:aminopeptidase P family protein [Phycisphaerae bacterium]